VTAIRDTRRGREAIKQAADMGLNRGTALALANLALEGGETPAQVVAALVWDEIQRKNARERKGT
jgi:hypothetical protein